MESGLRVQDEERVSEAERQRELRICMVYIEHIEYIEYVYQRACHCAS